KNTANQPCSKNKKRYARIAHRSFWGTLTRYFAPSIANQHIGGNQGSTMCKKNALSAENCSPLINIMDQEPAPGAAAQELGVKRVEYAGTADVYCLKAKKNKLFRAG
ncbi:MAG: hypothetical protein KAS32_15920, partial [Candidatus Peribacteraceae bacterium]|nr:hypothetical protein [Candidatus Peribacteraceae bacterium]